MKKYELPHGYSFREMEFAEFQPLWLKHAAEIFDAEGQIFRIQEHLNETEKADRARLGKNMGQPSQLRLAVFHGEEFVAWHTGNQENAESFYMRNSAVLPAHRGKGIYSALLDELLCRLTSQGFQRIYSRHNATNNAVIIPKLKAGFVITSLEISDAFGTLVHLNYFTNPLRRKVLDYRCGQIRPDDEIRQALKLP
jgi:GNAT superfamily N-acetyltransferase